MVNVKRIALSLVAAAVALTPTAALAVTESVNISGCAINGVPDLEQWISNNVNQRLSIPVNVNSVNVGLLQNGDVIDLTIPYQTTPFGQEYIGTHCEPLLYNTQFLIRYTYQLTDGTYFNITNSGGDSYEYETTWTWEGFNDPGPKALGVALEVNNVPNITIAEIEDNLVLGIEVVRVIINPHLFESYKLIDLR